MDKKETKELNNKVLRAIKTVYDHEIPVDVYELGLIYEINIKKNKDVHVLMTLTSPSCPAAESIPSDVKSRIEMIKEINDVDVEITFDPPYTSDLMSEEAKQEAFGRNDLLISKDLLLLLPQEMRKEKNNIF